MIISARDLRCGVEVDSGKFTLLYKEGDVRPYQICKYATKEALYTHDSLSHAVRTLNTLTGWNDEAMED